VRLIRPMSGAAPGAFGQDLRLDGVVVHPATDALPHAPAGPAAGVVELALTDLNTPVTRPGTVRDCVGFLQHIRNARRALGISEPLPGAWSVRPAFYFVNTASLRSASAPIAVTPGSSAFDFEFEIGAVIGTSGVDLTAEQAHASIAGYVLYCDWSARDIQSEEAAMGIGQGKGKDGAVSLGPWLLTADEAGRYRTPDGFDFSAVVRVNGETVLDTPFRGMDWSFEELLAYASSGVRIEPGDIIASGTVPGGCLLELSGREDFRGWLQPGDDVLLDGGPLGRIQATIDPAPPADLWRTVPTGDGGAHA